MDLELNSQITQNSTLNRSIFSFDNYLTDLKAEFQFEQTRKMEVLEQSTPNGGKDFIILEESSISN